MNDEKNPHFSRGFWVANRKKLSTRPDYPRIVLLSALFGTATSSYPVTVLSASLPRVAQDLGTSDDSVTWVLAAPLLAFAIITPIAGKLGDLHGHRRTYLGSFALGGILALLTALSWNVGSLIFMRTLAQAATAAAGPSAMAIILSVYGRKERSKALGMWMAVVAVSPAIGVVTGGPLIEWLGWRTLFIVQGLLVIVAFFIGARTLPETERKPEVTFDVPGALTLGLGVGGLLIAVNRGIVWGWNHPIVISAAVISPLALIAFRTVENRTKMPLLPPDLMSKSNFAIPIAVQAVLQAAYMGAMIIAPFLLERRWGFRPTVIGLLMLPRPLAFAIAAKLGGNHDLDKGARRVSITGCLVFAIAMLIAGIGAQQKWLIVFILGAGLAGAGSGYIRATIANAATSAAGDQDLGVAGGSLNMLQMVGGTVGITLATAMLGTSTSGSRFMAIHLAAGITALLAAFLATRIEKSTD
ncbi:MAG: Multidrug resistance protein Stp [Acidimicrobiaceae bacterium]|jgi:EmrB/QacA subfamily drug resistance transporter|nr:MAG: Multidrug resistance protein Stp [Acidimicrobiaceae bacterium]|tara:strand:- start:1267 stop:2676 length:1410 start_codon:yes stop_codon:yes gene_type:complete